MCGARELCQIRRKTWTSVWIIWPTRSGWYIDFSLKLLIISTKVWIYRNKICIWRELKSLDLFNIFCLHVLCSFTFSRLGSIVVHRLPTWTSSILYFALHSSHYILWLYLCHRVSLLTVFSTTFSLVNSPNIHSFFSSSCTVSSIFSLDTCYNRFHDIHRPCFTRYVIICLRVLKWYTQRSVPYLSKAERKRIHWFKLMWMRFSGSHTIPKQIL